MIKHRLGRLGLVAAAALMLMPLGGAVVQAGGVNIIYPPKLAADFDRPADKIKADDHIHKSEVKTTIQIRLIDRSGRRREAIRRAFGHRYLGFVKVYSGPRYPF